MARYAMPAMISIEATSQEVAESAVRAFTSSAFRSTCEETGFVVVLKVDQDESQIIEVTP